MENGVVITSLKLVSFGVGTVILQQVFTSSIFFLFAITNKEYNAFSTIANGTLFRLLTALTLFTTYCTTYLHYLNYNIYKTCKQSTQHIQ